MIAKLFDEHGFKWLLIDGVTIAEHYTHRFKLIEEQKPGSNPLVEELPEQNPPPKDYKGNRIYLARLLLKMTGEEIEEGRRFKVVGLFITEPSGNEIYRCYGFTSGYLLNGEGKTIEKL